VAEFISAWGDGRAQAPPLRTLPPVIARGSLPLSLRGWRSQPKQSHGPLCHCEERSDEAISLGAWEVATHPAGARKDGMIK
jgi:hypothetical protein